MAGLERKKSVIFAQQAAQRLVTAFRTTEGDNPQRTKDPNNIQNATWLQGWINDDNSGNVEPYAEDFNGVLYTLSYNTSYLYEKGIPEFSADQVYQQNSFCQYGGVIYRCRTDATSNVIPTNTNYWDKMETESYSATNIGTGGANTGGVYAGSSGTQFQFKRIVAGSNVTVSETDDSIVIASSGGGQYAAFTATSPLDYTNGVLSIPAASASQNGYLTASDWSSFSGKLSSTIFSANNTWTGTNTFDKILPSGINSALGDSSNLWNLYTAYILGDETFYFTYEDQRISNSRFLLGLYGGEMGLFPSMSSQDGYESSLGSSVYRWDHLYTVEASITNAYISTIKSIGTIVSPYDYQGNQSRIALSYNPPVLGGSVTQWGWLGYLSSSYIGIFPSTTETCSVGGPNNIWKEAYIKTIYSDSIPTNIEDLSNVTISSAANNQFLRFNGSAWTNQTVTIPSNLQDLSNVTISSAANGNYLKYDGSKWVNAAFPSTRVLKINSTDKVTVYCTSSGGAIDFGSYLPLSGGTMTGNIVPSGTRNLGSSSAYWADVYTNNYHCGAYASLSKYSTYGVQLIWTSSGSLTSVIGDGTAFFPSTNKTLNLGGTNNRWGTIYGISAVNTSDRRIKRNIVELTDALKKLNTIAVKSYTVDCISYGINYGFIAQDELERNPELVFVPEDYSEEEGGGELGFINNNVLFLAVKAIQELSAQVSDLETRLRRIENEN